MDIELKQPKLAGVTFGGTLQLQEDIRLVLEGLSVVTGLHYEQKANERRYVFEESTMNP